MDNKSSATATPGVAPEGHTIQVTKRTDRSIYMFILHHIIKLLGPQLIKARKIYPAGSPRLDPHSKAKKHCDIQERIVEDIYIYDLTAKHSDVTQKSNADGAQSGNMSKKGRLYYFAGGGWQMPPSSEHWALCAEFAKKLPGLRVSIVSYPLAPNSAAPATFSQMMKLYRSLLREADEAGEKVILAGDSAGGNIVLCLTLAALAEDDSAPCPSAILAISPSCDLRRHNPEIKLLEKHDPILRIPFINSTAQKWRGEWDPADPRVSPLLADVSLLARRGVQAHGVVGRYDILSPDAVLFRMKCDEAGVRGRWLDWEKQMHCFPLAWSFGLPESVEAKDWILDVLQQS